MSEETGQEKTEQPTGRRLEKAVEDGQILTSRDLVMAMVLLVGCVQFYLFGRFYYQEIRNAFSFGLDFYNPLARDLPLTHVLADRFGSALVIMLAFAIPIMVFWANAAFRRDIDRLVENPLQKLSDLITQFTADPFAKLDDIEHQNEAKDIKEETYYIQRQYCNLLKALQGSVGPVGNFILSQNLIKNDVYITTHI